MTQFARPRRIVSLGTVVETAWVVRLSLGHDVFSSIFSNLHAF